METFEGSQAPPNNGATDEALAFVAAELTSQMIADELDNITEWIPTVVPKDLLQTPSPEPNRSAIASPCFSATRETPSPAVGRYAERLAKSRKDPPKNDPFLGPEPPTRHARAVPAASHHDPWSEAKLGRVERASIDFKDFPAFRHLDALEVAISGASGSPLSALSLPEPPPVLPLDASCSTSAFSPRVKNASCSTSAFSPRAKTATKAAPPTSWASSTPAATVTAGATWAAGSSIPRIGHGTPDFGPWLRCTNGAADKQVLALPSPRGAPLIPAKPGASARLTSSALRGLAGVPLAVQRHGPAATSHWLAMEATRMHGEAPKSLGTSSACAFLVKDGPAGLEKLDEPLLSERLQRYC